MNFEEFTIENGFDRDDPKELIHIYNMRVAWDAALEEGRKQGLEEAAKMVEKECWGPEQVISIKKAAIKIRALKGEQ